MIRLEQVKLPLDYTDETLARVAADTLGIRPDAVRRVEIVRRSVDARRKPNLRYVATIAADVRGENELLAHGKARPFEPGPASIDDLGLSSCTERCAVIGSGPAGLFAALALARAGAKPIVIERGAETSERIAAVERFRTTGVLDEQSNVQFGEGGAGTFSDGKLNTGTANPLIGAVLGEFVRHGAPEEIRYLAKPHIGTDLLRGVVRSIREEIVALGGEVLFKTRAADIVLRQGELAGLVLEGARTGELETNRAIFAIGHSARDTYEMLAKRGVPMTQKPFSVGVRAEHLQKDIDLAQYGSAHPPFPADYKLAAQLPDGRGVYTFCMCPGGEVVCAASETGGIAVNGMSRYARNGVNANAAVLVSVDGADFGEDLFAGMRFQRELERKAFAASGAYRAPCQTFGDFVAGRTTTAFGRVRPSILPAPVCADLNEILPAFAADGIRTGMTLFGQKLRGYDAADTVLTGVETRSSAPVRILRDERFESGIRGLFPVGEGAGYAGGITSAAVDGLRCAIELIRRGSKQ